MTFAIERAARRAARSAVRRVAAAGSVAVLVVLAAAGGVAAHGETYFQLGAERIQPGAQIEVRADLGTGDAFDITLVARSGGARRDLGVLPATEEGHLQTFLTIPADVPPGDYLVEIAWDVTVLRTPLTVVGPPIVAEGEGGQPGQDEPFAGASSLPGDDGGATGPSSGPLASAQPSSPVGGRRDGIDGLGIVAIAGIAAVTLVGALRLLRPGNTPRA